MSSDSAAQAGARARVEAGITVLLRDSVALLQGRRIGLLTNQTGRDEFGRPDIDLLFESPRAKAAGAKLAVLFAPEHGIRGTEDREGLSDTVDDKTGVPIIQLYKQSTAAPPDSMLRRINVLVLDLQDIGTRTWTYVGAMVFAMQATAKAGIPILVLDRPAPITGTHVEGPLLDPSLAEFTKTDTSVRTSGFALYPMPLRHGLTMGELARFFNTELRLGADLHVIPMKGYRRSMWQEDTGIPWVKPSPNLPTLTGALLYPALVALEATNVSVGRGTPLAHERFGAPWLNNTAVIQLLESRRLPGLRFVAETFPANAYGEQQPYKGQVVPGVRIIVTNRDSVDVGRLGAAITWALVKTHSDSLRVHPRAFDMRWGRPAMRERLLRGEDPDAVLASDTEARRLFVEKARRYWLY